jgi:hypothetical protein
MLPHNIVNPNNTRLPVTKQANKEYINEMRLRYGYDPRFPVQNKGENIGGGWQ